jgi:hypothetical protein
VAFGDTLYRAIDAAETLKEQGYKVGVLNKPTLNVVDEEALKKIAGSGFVLVAETQNQVTGLGSRFGTWLLEATPRATSIWALPNQEKAEEWNKWDSMVLSRNIWLRRSRSWFDKGLIQNAEDRSQKSEVTTDVEYGSEFGTANPKQRSSAASA